MAAVNGSLKASITVIELNYFLLYLTHDFCGVFEKSVDVGKDREEDNRHTNGERLLVGRLHLRPEDAVESLHGDGKDGEAGSCERYLSEW